MSELNLLSEQDMDRCIGHALAWWNHVEDDLGNVFCAVFGGVNNASARAAYLAIVAFKLRLKVVDAALSEAQLSSDLVERWRVLKREVNEASLLRNRFTHFSRITVPAEAVYLVPTFWEGPKWSQAMSGKGHRYTWPEVWRHGEEFGRIAIHLSNLATDIEIRVRNVPPLISPSTL